MNSNTFRVPACVLASTALLLAASPAYAHGDGGKGGEDGGGSGRAGAVVLRAGLDVGLLNKTVDVPVRTSLNEVTAPGNADRTALTVELDGVGGGQPVSMVKAQVATARATADKERATGFAELAHAKVHVPGLPLLSLIEVEKVTAEAVCAAGAKPTAEANVLGAVSVLGRKVTLTAGGPTKVSVPAVGDVTLELAKRSTTDDSAAATALQLQVSVDPLQLNVAEVTGTLTLVEATCASPEAAPGPKPEEKPETETETAAQPDDEPAADPAPDTRPQGGGEPDPQVENLAATGGSSTTPYLAGGAAVLVLAGGGALVAARRRG
ncbi:SCO1860 family LAETG-anchored protein [Streptomyces sp. NPDC060194]|uniref:SCO1860 family LAETG-anchored protein n=1 Tax=Streptomyces sp. NPDC060194 TaxID=3347069 RepID=UPI00365A03B7